MNKDFLNHTIDAAIERSNLRIAELSEVQSDLFKIGRLHEIAGELQGTLTFLRQQMNEEKEPRKWRFWKK